MNVTIRKGLNLPVKETVSSTTENADPGQHFAILGRDFIGMKPTMLVKEGDAVVKGQALFSDKKNDKIIYTSPASGSVKAINRGAKRKFLSLVVHSSNPDQGEKTFSSYKGDELTSLNYDKVRDLLIESGQWPSIRTRPFSKVANPEKRPNALFITCMDTSPYAPDVNKIIEENKQSFEHGLKVLAHLPEGPMHVCHDSKFAVSLPQIKNLQEHTFSGVHPAGLVGTHIHYVDPVGWNKMAWHLDFQEVIAIGALFTSGKIFSERVVSLCGKGAKKGVHLKTRAGACLSEVTKSWVEAGNNRLISGNLLAGQTAEGAHDYLGRFHRTISVVPEGDQREFLGWAEPGLSKFSNKSVFLSSLLPGKKYQFNTNLNGSPRSMVPIGTFEKVMPLDIIPTFLLRALLSKDTDTAQDLGALELDEEDLSLCTFVCPGKTDYAPHLRESLTIIERDG